MERKWGMLLPGIGLVALGTLWLLNMYDLMVDGIFAILVGAGFAVWYFMRGKIWALIVSAALIFPAGIAELAPSLMREAGTLALASWIDFDGLCVGLGFLYVFGFGKGRVGIWCMWVGLGIIGLCLLEALAISNLFWPIALIAGGTVVLVTSIRNSQKNGGASAPPSEEKS